MSTTTIVYAASDSYLRSDQPTTNNGTSTLLRMGYYSGGNLRHGVMQFDVSAFTDPNAIVAANLTLIQQNSFGSSVREMKVARLDQSFVEDECTWNIAETGTDWTGGAGADGNAADTQPTYTIDVGDSSGNQTIDIKDLVIDAINRRAGTLRLVFYIDDSGTAIGNAVFYSRSAGSNNPTLGVIVADRIAWTGSADDDLDTDGNWEGGTAPTADDIALFNTGSVDAQRGSLQCRRIYVGRNYTGNIGLSTSEITFEAEEVRFNSYTSEIYLVINEAISTIAQVYISDTGRTEGTFTLDGKYDATITRTRHDISLDSADSTRIDAHSSTARFTLSDDVTVVRISKAYATLNDGAGSVTVSNRGFATVKNSATNDTDITINNASVICLADQVDQIIMHSGVLRFRNNVGAPIIVAGLTLYASAIADTRTGAATYPMSHAATIYGGQLLMDGSQSVSIA